MITEYLRCWMSGIFRDHGKGRFKALWRGLGWSVMAFRVSDLWLRRSWRITGGQYRSLGRRQSLFQGAGMGYAGIGMGCDGTG
jgi:hypothetical protein